MASSGSAALVGEVSPADAWDLLGREPGALLVDVRTRAEWGFVGGPDLTGIGKAPVCVEWAAFPDMSENPRFVAELMEQIEGTLPSHLLFLCRSGARSLRAAETVAAHLSDQGRAAACLNVAEGFEGDLDPERHRGVQNGWKARGLAWRQS